MRNKNESEKTSSGPGTEALPLTVHTEGEAPSPSTLPSDGTHKESIFKRLGVKSFGEEVYALVDTGLNEIENETLPEASETHLPEAQDAQPLPHNSWEVCKLIALLPNDKAHVAIPVPQTGQQENGSQPEQQFRNFHVHVDNLRPYKQPEKQQEPPPPLNPILASDGKEIDAYNFNGRTTEIAMKTRVCLAMTMNWQGAVKSSMDGVKTFCLPKWKSFQVVLNCRAQRDFKKKQLMLVPDIPLIDELFEMGPEVDGEKPPFKVDEKGLSKKLARLYPGLMQQVHCSIQMLAKDKRRKLSADKDDRKNRTTHYYAVRSPLLDVRGAGLELEIDDLNLNPFWTVLRYDNRLAVANMELIWDEIAIPDLAVPDRDKSSLFATLRVPRLRSTADIKKGDVLTLGKLDNTDL